MPVVLSGLVFAVLVALLGFIAGWCLHAAGARGKPGERHAERQYVREALARVQELATHVAADVGEHSSRVEEINEELSSSDAPETEAVLSAVGKLVDANTQMQQQLASAEEKLREQARQIECQTAEARTDALTRLANRRAFDDQATRCFAEFQRHGAGFSVVMLDVDHFKEFNDRHGHQAGDAVLRGMGDVLRKNAREMDLAARYGGEEFAMILPRTSIAEARTIAARVREAITRARFRIQGMDLQVSASIGVANILLDEDLPALIRRADEALYASKNSGRNCTHWHDGQMTYPVRVEKESASTENDAEELRSQPSPAEVQAPKAQPSPSAVDRLRDDDGKEMCDRSGFCTSLGRRLAQWRRGAAAPSVVLVRVDDYPDIVSRHGDPAGKAVLRATIRLLKAALRDVDLVARYGDETLAVLLLGAPFADTVSVVERLREAIAQCVLPLDSGRLKFTVSISGAEATDKESISRLLLRSEEALDAAWKAGGNCTFFHNGQWCEMAGALLERIGP